jgi:hypothetical protein
MTQSVSAVFVRYASVFSKKLMKRFPVPEVWQSGKTAKQR